MRQYLQNETGASIIVYQRGEFFADSVASLNSLVVVVLVLRGVREVSGCVGAWIAGEKPWGLGLEMICICLGRCLSWCNVCGVGSGDLVLSYVYCFFEALWWSWMGNEFLAQDISDIFWTTGGYVWHFYLLLLNCIWCWFELSGCAQVFISLISFIVWILLILI